MCWVKLFHNIRSDRLMNEVNGWNESSFSQVFRGKHIVRGGMEVQSKCPSLRRSPDDCTTSTVLGRNWRTHWLCELKKHQNNNC